MPSQEILQVIVVPFIQEKSWTYFESSNQYDIFEKGILNQIELSKLLAKRHYQICLASMISSQHYHRLSVIE